VAGHEGLHGHDFISSSIKLEPLLEPIPP
jgi:hypothetical protein